MNIPQLPCGISYWQWIDAHGFVFPWFTRPCLEVIDHWDLTDKRVLEYGAGYSTFWWASRGADIVSVDNDAQWVDSILTAKPKATVVHATQENSYVNIAAAHTWDVIVVDGAFRRACLSAAFEHIRIGGHIIFDNWTDAIGAEPLRFNTSTVYPQPTHPDWQTKVWHVTTKTVPPANSTVAEAQFRDWRKVNDPFPFELDHRGRPSS